MGPVGEDLEQGAGVRWGARSRREVRSTEQEWGEEHRAGAGWGAQSRREVRSTEQEWGGEHKSGAGWGAQSGGGEHRAGVR